MNYDQPLPVTMVCPVDLWLVYIALETLHAAPLPPYTAVHISSHSTASSVGVFWVFLGGVWGCFYTFWGVFFIVFGCA